MSYHIFYRALQLVSTFLINMHIFFLNTYQNKQTRVLGENPAQEQTNETPLT